jgi:hypothetical protein
MGYRPLYLLVRTLYRLRREPQAVLMLWSFVAATFCRAPRLSDERVRKYLREQQRLRSLPRRAREARGQIV